MMDFEFLTVGIVLFFGSSFALAFGFSEFWFFFCFSYAPSLVMRFYLLWELASLIMLSHIAVLLLPQLLN